jgi:hypothetical protein
MVLVNDSQMLEAGTTGSSFFVGIFIYFMPHGSTFHHCRRHCHPRIVSCIMLPSIQSE